MSSDPEAAPTTPLSRFSFVIGRAMGTVVVTTHGLLDTNSARALGNALVDLIDDQGNLAVVVDVADLELSDQLCLAALARPAAAAARRRCRLTFADPSGAIERGLTLAGLVTVTSARLAAMFEHPAGSATSTCASNADMKGAAR